MKFLIKKERDKNFPFKILYNNIPENCINYIYFGDNKLLAEFTEKNEKIFVIGDLINFDERELSFHLLYHSIISNRVHEFGGFFYLIYLKECEIKVYSSLFNILPVYFYENQKQILISSKLDLIIQHLTHKPALNKKYLLERVLFNYGIFNDTYFEGIELLRANHYLSLESSVQQLRQFTVSDLYAQNIKKGKNVLNHLADYFIDLTKYFLPVQKYALSFTGGFDGRTLLAVSKYYKRDFIAYSFGSEDSSDLILPKNQAFKLDVLFEPIILNENYINNDSYDSGLEFIELSEGLGSFARAHYVFSAKHLSHKVNYLVTGNFGSELFRAMHNQGVVLSRELIEVFKNHDKDKWIDILKTSPKINFLLANSYEKELERIIEEIDEFKSNYHGLSENQLFYVFVLSEVFRKYFGPEIIIQLHFIFNRTPFLNFLFIKELFQTYYCGIYSDFFTDNPAKRFKGQLLYAYIIKKAFPELLHYYTNKGYKPSHLLTNLGKYILVYNFAKKRLLKERAKKGDFFSVQSAFHHNKEKWLSIPILMEYYSKSDIHKYVSDYHDPDLIYNILSSNYYLNQYF